MGPPWGTLGPYLRIPSVEYFPNVFFWASWTPWASPYLQMQWEPRKNLKIFQGAVLCLSAIITATAASIEVVVICGNLHFNVTALVAALILHFDAVFGFRIKKKNALTLNINTEHAMSSIFIWTKGHVDMHIDYFSLLPQIKKCSGSKIAVPSQIWACKGFLQL